MSANPNANGGLLLKELRLPDFRDYAVEVPAPGRCRGGGDQRPGSFIRDVMNSMPAAGIFAFSARTRRIRTAGRPFSRSPIGSLKARLSPSTITWRPAAA